MSFHPDLKTNVLADTEDSLLYGRLCHIGFDWSPVSLCGRPLTPAPGTKTPSGPVCSRCATELMKLYEAKVG